MNFKILKRFVEGLVELCFIGHCIGFWMSVLEEQSNVCSVWVTDPIDFP